MGILSKDNRPGDAAELRKRTEGVARKKTESN